MTTTHMERLAGDILRDDAWPDLVSRLRTQYVEDAIACQDEGESLWLLQKVRILDDLCADLEAVHSGKLFRRDN